MNRPASVAHGKALVTAIAGRSAWVCVERSSLGVQAEAQTPAPHRSQGRRGYGMDLMPEAAADESRVLPC